MRLSGQWHAAYQAGLSMVVSSMELHAQGGDCPGLWGLLLGDQQQRQWSLHLFLCRFVLGHDKHCA